MCKTTHKYSETGFPINIFAQNQLKNTSVNSSIRKTNAYNETCKKIIEIGQLCDRFKLNLEKADFLNDEYNSLIANIDVKTECIQEAVNQNRENLINQIKDAEQKALSRFNTIDLVLKNKFKKLLHGSKVSLNKMVDLLENERNINNAELNRLSAEATGIKYDLKTAHDDFISNFFNENRLYFHSNDSIRANAVGKLSKTLLTGFDFDRIIGQKSIMKIPFYKQIIDESILNEKTAVYEFKSGLVCVICLTSRFQADFKIQFCLYSSGCDLIRTFSEVVTEDSFLSAKLRNALILNLKKSYQGYNERKSTNFNMLVIYDEEFKTKYSKKLYINYQPSLMYTSGSLVYVLENSKKCFVYNEDLELLRSFDFVASYILNGKTSIIGDRIFNSKYSEINIHEADNLSIIENVKFKDALFIQDHSLFQAVTENIFATISGYYFELFDLKLDCLIEFKINNIETISWFNFTESGLLLILDNRKNILYIL